MAEEETDSKKKKKKAKATTSTANLARSRYKTNRPDLKKRVLRIVRSNSVEKANEFAKKHTEITGLEKLIEKGNVKKEEGKFRKFTRKADRTVKLRLLDRRMDILSSRIDEITGQIKKRKDVEAQLREEQAANPENPINSSLLYWLESHADFPELHDRRKKLKDKLEKKQIYREIILK